MFSIHMGVPEMEESLSFENSLGTLLLALVPFRGKITTADVLHLLKIRENQTSIHKCLVMLVVESSGFI